MKIIADQNIARLDNYFSTLGEVLAVNGRTISNALLKKENAEILLVRSVTEVNKKLLKGTGISFVGSTTAGINHIDVSFLDSEGIFFCHAPGSNATAVTEYVLSALACILLKQERQLSEISVGIVGAGNVGGRLLRKCQELGVCTFAYDPLLHASSEFFKELVDLSQVLEQDVITFHTPLTHTGTHPTYHLLDRKKTDLIRPGTILINTSRGEVVDNAAILDRIKSRNDLITVFDVWEGEPEISGELLALVNYGSPHIAGHSTLGKVKATQAVFEHLVQYLDRESFLSSQPELQSNPEKLELTPPYTIEQCLKAAYDISVESEHFKQLQFQPDIGKGFDSLRKNYNTRREFSEYCLPENKLSEKNAQLLKRLDFKLC